MKGVERPQQDTSPGKPIDWRRVAEPQPDQYDTEITLECAKARGYVRRAPGDAVRCFDGVVAIDSEEYMGFSQCVPAPSDHPHIAQACELIRLWPTVFTQCKRLLDTIAVFLDPSREGESCWGSQCGPGSRGFGAIASTITSVPGFAEAIVHEMGHHKLRVLGIGLEAAEHLLTNPSAQTYPSPIRYDCLRPMPAVVHAQYSYTYIAALDLEIIRAGTDPALARRFAELSLAVILPKLDFGLGVIRKHAQMDESGAAFLEGLYAWIERVLEKGFRVLTEFQVAPIPLVHPWVNTSLRQVSRDLWKDHPKPRRRGTIDEHPLGEEVLLYVPEKEQGFTLNHSARDIWELCDGQRTEDDITHILATRYDHDPNALLGDVQAAVAQLREWGLVESGECI